MTAWNNLIRSVYFLKTPMHKVFKDNRDTSWSSDKSYKGTLR